nr:hypothetical protein [Chloroflexota bacterium]
LDRHPTQFGRMLAAADRALGQPIDAVVAGEADDPRALALRRAAAAPYAPDLVIAPLPDGAAFAGWPLFEGKTMRDGAPTAYVCRGYACDAPAGDPEQVTTQVTALVPTRPPGEALP